MIRISDKDFENFIKGKESAFDHIFNQYYRSLLFFSTKHGLELTEAEDIVMDTFHKIWQMREEIQSASALNSLLFTLTRNRTLNVVRNLKNRSDINSMLQLDDWDEGFEKFFLEEEMLRILESAIGKLSNQCREVILLYLSGNSVPEIAEKLNLSVNTIKTHKSHAIMNLRRLLEIEPNETRRRKVLLLISLIS